MSRTTRFVAVVAAGAAFATAGVAFAGINSEFDAKIRNRANDKAEYLGKVTSDLEVCQVGRKVKISAPGANLGNAFTDENGKFSRKDERVPEGTTVKFKLIEAGEECPGLKVLVQT